jgi:hypothetical protein
MDEVLPSSAGDARIDISRQMQLREMRSGGALRHRL